MSKIISADDLANYMKQPLLTNDTTAQQVVDAINAWIENRTKRCFGEIKTITERYDFGNTLWLHRQDIQAVSQIDVGWPGQTETTLDATGYYYNRYGRVTMFWRPQSYNVSQYYNDLLNITYSYGVETTPQDLVLAALGIAAGFYNYATNGQKDIVASSVDTYHVQFSGSVRGAAGVPDPAKSTDDANWVIVDSYRQRGH